MADLKVRLGRAHKWSDAAKARLMFLWESAWSLEAIARRMGRSPLACYRKAAKLGLPTGCPPGYEYFTAAARRAGYAEHTFRRVLAFSGVKCYRALADPLYVGKGDCPHHFVDPEAVNRAVAKWMASESVAVAARRLGMSPHTLRRWLQTAGVVGESQPGHRFHQRAAAEDIDRVAAEYGIELERTQSDRNRQAASIRWQRHREQRSAA
jgi:transposase-like protein